MNINSSNKTERLNPAKTRINDDKPKLDQRISELPGVYIAQGQFLNQESLDAVYGTYQHVPKKPFWYLKFSYNYLKDLGIPLSDEELLEMRNGTRLYLLPNTLNT